LEKQHNAPRLQVQKVTLYRLSLITLLINSILNGGMKYNRTNRTDRLNKACKSISTWGDTKMYDRSQGVLVLQPKKGVTIYKTKRMMKHKS